MWTRLSVAAHPSAEGLAARYRAARDPVERSRLRMVWLLVSGRSLSEVAEVTGYSTRWVREVVRRYNEDGPDRLADQRHGNCGAEPPPDGGLWTSATVARWIGERTGRAHVAAQRGWDCLRRLDDSPQVPRPRHQRAADTEAKAAFQKG